MNILFEYYTENDYNDLEDMIFALYDEDPEGLPITGNKIIKTADESVSHPEKVRIIMIRSGGKNIGYGIIAFSWSNEYGGDAVVIDELFVRKEYRNQQAATSFIKHIIETYKNAVLFEVETTPSNMDVLRIYEKSGFAVSANTHMIRAADQE